MKPIIKGMRPGSLRDRNSEIEDVDSVGGKNPSKVARAAKDRGVARKKKVTVEINITSKGDPAKTTPYADDLMSFAHDMAVDLFEVGLIDQTTMREIDDLVLTPVKELSPDEIKNLRVCAGLSQAVLARVLNVTSSSVSQWERGEKNPSGSVLKLLSLASDKGMQAIM